MNDGSEHTEFYNEFLETIIDSITMPMYVIDTNYNIIMANTASGLKDKIGEAKCYIETHGNKVPCCNEHPCPLEIIKQTKKDAIVEHIHYDKSGEKKLVTVHGFPVLDSKNNLSGMVELSIINEEKSAVLLDIEASENKYRALFESSNDALMTLKPPEWNFRSGNPSAIKLFNVKDEEEFNSLKPWDISPEYQADGMLSSEKAKMMIEKAMAEGSNFFEWIHKKYNGEPFPATVLLTKMSLNDEEFIQATVRDKTEQKLAEMKLKESEEKLVKMTEQIPLPLFEADLTGNITYVNKSALKTFGYDDNDFINGMNIFQMISPEIRDIIKKRISLIIKGASPSPTEYNAIRKDGTEFPVIAYANTNIKDGKVIGTRGFIFDISDRKKIEEELKENEAKLSSITNSAKDAIIMMDNDGIIMFWNPAAEAIFGYSEAEIIGKTLHETLAPESFRSSHRAAFPNWQLTGEGNAVNKTLDLSAIRKDGTEILVELSLSSIKQHGNWIAVGILRDITERKKIEDALKTSEKRLRDFIEHAPIGLYRTTPSGKILMANPALVNILGFSSLEELQKRDIENEGYDTPEVRKQFQEILERDGEIHAFEQKFLKKDGTPIFVNEYASIVKDNNDKIKYYDGIIEDITERKIAEETLSLAHNQMKNMLDNIDEVFYSNDFINRKTLIMSPACEKVYGYPPEAFYAKNDLWLDVVYPEDRHIVDASFPELLAGRTVLSQFRIIHFDGSIRWIEVKVKGILNTEGILIRVDGISTDINERKESEIKLKKYADELKELNFTKDKFFSIIAHDLKSPLGSFRNILELMVENFDNFDEKTIKEMIYEMHKSTKNIYGLLDNLLKWAGTQTGRIEFKPELNDLNNIIMMTISLLHGVAQIKGITISTELAQDCRAKIDVNMIETVIRNLISNAIKFTEVQGTIIISSKESDGFIQVSVSDSGVGMSEDAISKLFRLDTTHSTLGTAKEKGTGLGLILCKEFVEKHGGTIWVESEIYVGSKFTFKIPK